MPEPPKRPPPLPRQPSSPELQRAEVDKTVGAGQGYAVSQEYVRPELSRRGTLPGGMAAIPEAQTVPAPNPLTKKTWRVPTPPSAVAQARRSDPPMGQESMRSQTPVSGQPEAFSEVAQLRARVAELERRERVRVETASPNTYPPRVEERRPSPPGGTPAPTSTPPDAELGKAGRWVARKAWPYIVAALGLGGGAVGALKPAADPAKADATLATVEAMRADIALLREQMAGMLKREAARDAYLRCVDEGMVDLGTQLLPAQDRQGASQPLRAFVDRCQRLRP